MKPLNCFNFLKLTNIWGKKKKDFNARQQYAIILQLNKVLMTFDIFNFA